MYNNISIYLEEIVMESDLLWHEIYDTPEDNYYAYRQLWMRVCGAISQGGKPVVFMWL